VGNLDRGEFLRLGAVGAVAGLLGHGGIAAAAPPPPTPQGDDLGFVQWGAVAEMVSVAFWRRALADGDFSERVRRRLRAARDTDREHLARLTAVLGDDAPKEEDFEITLPDAAFKSRARIFALGLEIEQHVTGVYLDGVTRTTDQQTRLLLGRLLVSDSGHLSVLRGLDGQAIADSGLRNPVSVESAGDWVDRFIRSRSFPTE
jgi:Ferritin-like domain